MIQVVPRWQVDVELASGKRVSVWIADSFIENVMRKLSDMSFSPNSLDRVESITVHKLAPATTAVAVDPQVTDTGKLSTRDA